MMLHTLNIYTFFPQGVKVIVNQLWTCFMVENIYLFRFVLITLNFIIGYKFDNTCCVDGFVLNICVAPSTLHHSHNFLSKPVKIESELETKR